MKKYIFIMFVALSSVLSAQTSKELLGKWKLVKWEHNNEPQDIKAVFNTDQIFQVFKKDFLFEGIIGENKDSGKWELSKEGDTQVLNITVNGESTKFKTNYFDAAKRVISNDQLGILTYQKIDDVK